MPNLSADWDGELERQQHESPRNTAYRHLQERREDMTKEEYDSRKKYISSDDFDD